MPLAMKQLRHLLLWSVVCWLVPVYSMAQTPPSNDTIEYQCWFDEDYNTLQRGILGTSPILVDVSSISNGVHSLNVQFGSDSTAQLSRHFFFRIPTSSDTTHATIYSCWFDEDYNTLQTGNIGNGLIMLDVSALTEGFHTVNVQYETGVRFGGTPLHRRLPA